MKRIEETHSSIIRFVIPVVFIIKLDWGVCIVVLD